MANELSDGNPSGFGAAGDQRDRLFDVLSHPYRRFVLDTLLTVETPVPVSELSTELVAGTDSAPDGSGGEADAVELSLVHNHLPRMAEVDLVEYDAAERTVTLADRTDEAWAYLQTVKEQT